jgi:hypothetical protein
MYRDLSPPRTNHTQPSLLLRIADRHDGVRQASFLQRSKFGFPLADMSRNSRLMHSGSFSVCLSLCGFFGRLSISNCICTVSVHPLKLNRDSRRELVCLDRKIPLTRLSPNAKKDAWANHPDISSTLFIPLIHRRLRILVRAGQHHAFSNSGRT